MKIFFRILCVSLMCGWAFASCADEKDEDYYELEQAFIDSWVANNINNNLAPGEEPAVKQSNGMYVQWLEHAEEETGVNPIDSSWVRIKYTGYNLKNEIFVTRDKDKALQMGYYSPYTNYDADFVQLLPYSTLLSEGQKVVLKRMRAGDKVRIVMPSKIARMANTDIMSSNGYGNGLPYNSEPVMMEMELTEVVRVPDNISVTEEPKIDGFVRDYKSANPGADFKEVRGKDDADGDPTYETYLKYSVITEGTGDKVQSSETMLLQYEVRFVENDFLLSTNIAALGLAEGRDVTSYRALPYRPSVEVFPSSEESGGGQYVYFEEYYFPHRALRRVFDDGKFTYGTEFISVFKSEYNDWWFDENLSTSSVTYWYQTYWYTSEYNSVPATPVILPYTSLYAKIKIIGQVKDGENIIY